MKIQELESQTGLDRATIRFYEREGMIRPRREENGYRNYSGEDASQLMKIKLLRQLEMTLEQIKRLQLGSADVSEEMEKQIALLSSKIGEHQRAKAVCNTIHEDGVQYGSMDAERYLALLQEVRKDDHDSFREAVPRECHPFRRFFARKLDRLLFAALVSCFLYVVLRIRPIPGEVFTNLQPIVYGLVFVPIEASLLHFWGTTPGKWVFGIQVSCQEGGKLRFSDALQRSWRVFSVAQGFHIPVIELICQAKCFSVLTGIRFHITQGQQEPRELSYDDKVEITYNAPAWIRILPLALIWLGLLSLYCGDIVKPANLGDTLSVKEFAENYNNTAYFLHLDLEKLDENGIIEDNPYDYASEKFSYTLEQGRIRKVSYEKTWEYFLYHTSIDDPCFVAGACVLLARDNFGIAELREFSLVWQENVVTAHSNMPGEFTYRDVTFRWYMTVEDGSMKNGILFPEEDGEECSVSVHFEMIIP